MSIIATLKFAKTLESDEKESLLRFKVKLAYDIFVINVFEGTVFNPPYHGKAAHLVLKPKVQCDAEKMMLDFVAKEKQGE